METVSQERLKRPERLAIVCIIAAAFLIRFIGISFGLPDAFHADEPNVVNRAVAYGAGDLNPHYFKIPPFISYLVFISYGIYYLIGRAVGYFSGTEDFAVLFFEDSTSFYLLARFLFGVLPGTFSVYLLYRVINKYFSQQQALLAAFFFAFSFLHVRDSHFIYLDIPLVTLIILSFFPILNVVTNKGTRKDYVIFGILAGLSAANKYNGSFVYLPFFAAHFLSKGINRSGIFDMNLLISFALSGITFVTAVPFVLFDFPAFFKDLIAMKEFEGYIGFFHHIRYSTVSSLGIPLTVASISGLVLAFIRRRKTVIPILVFTLSYYVVLCYFGQLHDRYVLPVLPFLLFFAADALIELRKRFKYPAAVHALIAVMVLSPSLGKAIMTNQLLLRDDVRTLARQWVELYIPTESRIAIDDPLFSPRLKTSLVQLEEKRREASGPLGGTQLKRLGLMISIAQNDAGPRYQLYFLDDVNRSDFLFAKPRLRYNIQEIKEHKIDYVIITKIKEGYREHFYNEVTKSGTLVKRFTPYRDPARQWPISDFALTGAPSLWSEFLARNRNGHIIEIYKI